MPRAPLVVHALPFVPAVAGILVGAWRFRAGDPLIATGIVLGGLLGMLVLVLWIPGPARR